VEKLLLTLGIIFAGLFIGCGIQLYGRRKRLDLARLRSAIQRVCLLGLVPVTVTASIWILDLHNPLILVLPLLGAAAIVAGGFYAFISAHLLRLPRSQTGVFIVSGSFTNIGSIGGLIVFAFFGEHAFALMPFYKLFEELLYYGLGFPLAKSFSDGGAAADTAAGRIRAILTDPFIIVAFAAVAAGFGLNVSGLSRPEFFGPLNAVLIPLVSFLLMASIGMGMRFSAVGKYVKPAFVIAAIKLLVVPATVLALALAFGLGTAENQLVLKVVLVLASGPCAFISIIPPALYKLDLDLANANWLLSNALLVLLVPALWFVTGLM
jgi:predicted permease